jgi:hypothetical protein
MGSATCASNQPIQPLYRRRAAQAIHSRARKGSATGSRGDGLGTTPETGVWDRNRDLRTLRRQGQGNRIAAHDPGTVRRADRNLYTTLLTDCLLLLNPLRLRKHRCARRGEFVLVLHHAIPISSATGLAPLNPDVSGITLNVGFQSPNFIGRSSGSGRELPAARANHNSPNRQSPRRNVRKNPFLAVTPPPGN